MTSKRLGTVPPPPTCRGRALDCEGLPCAPCSEPSGRAKQMRLQTGAGRWQGNRGKKGSDEGREEGGNGGSSKEKT